MAEAGLVVVGFPKGSGKSCHRAEVLTDFVEKLCTHVGVRESFEAQDSSDEHVDAIQRGVALRFQKPFPPSLPFGLRLVDDFAEVRVVLADFRRLLSQRLQILSATRFDARSIRSSDDIGSV